MFTILLRLVEYSGTHFLQRRCPQRRATPVGTPALQSPPSLYFVIRSKCAREGRRGNCFGSDGPPASVRIRRPQADATAATRTVRWLTMRHFRPM